MLYSTRMLYWSSACPVTLKDVDTIDLSDTNNVKQETKILCIIRGCADSFVNHKKDNDGWH